MVVVNDSLAFLGLVESGTDYIGASNPVPFKHIKTIKGDQWDIKKNQFTIREPGGIYFIGLNVRAPNYINYTLMVSGQPFSGITRTSNIMDYDHIGKDVIGQFTTGDVLQIYSGFSIYFNNDYFETSLVIFSISNSMDSPVAFSVANEDDISGTMHPYPFDIILYNKENHFNISGHHFTAPSAGIYYFSMSAGLYAGNNAHFIFCKNGVPFASLFRNSTTYNGNDTIGRSVMTSLGTGDLIQIRSFGGQKARSSNLKETSFSGFKYEPKHGNRVLLFLFISWQRGTFILVFILFMLIKLSYFSLNIFYIGKFISIEEHFYIRVLFKQ